MAVEAPYAVVTLVIYKKQRGMYMTRKFTRFEEYVYEIYEKHISEIDLCGMAPEEKTAFDKINEALGEEYVKVMASVEAYHGIKEFKCFMLGFQNGIKFLIRNLVD